MNTASTGPVLVPELLSRHARSHPDRTPLCVDGKRWLSYGEWEARANGVAHGLLARGARRGDRVGLLFGGLDWIDYATAYLGILKAGCTATHLSDLLEPEELRRRIGHAGPIGLLHGRSLTAPGWFEGWTATAASADTGDETPPEVEIGPEDICDILYTSGTTGPAKPFTNPHGNLAFGHGWGAHAEAIFDHTAPMLLPLPVSSAYSASTAGVFALTTTAPILLSRPDDVERMAEHIGTHRVTSAMLRPRAAMRMVRTRVGDRHDLSSVTVLGVASGALPPRYARQLLAMMPNAKIVTAYGGGSEAVPAHLRTVYDPDQPQNMGRAQPGTDLLIVGADGEPVSPGRRGEIWLRTEAPLRRYLDEALNAEIHVLGWVRTGDLGHLNDNDELIFFDRGDDAVPTEAGLVSSIDLEHAIYEHPAVAEVAVFAPAGSRQVAAAVVLAGAGDPPDLRAFLAGRVKPHEIPVVHVVDALPRGRVSDKILKSRLRERFAVG